MSENTEQANDKTPTPTPTAGGQNAGTPVGDRAAQGQGQDPAAQADQTPNQGSETIHQIPQSKLEERLRRAEESAISKLLKSLGVSNADELTTLVRAEKARQEGELSDLQKAQRDLKAVTAERDRLKTRYDALVSRLQRAERDGAIREAASQAKKPEHVIMWIEHYKADELTEAVTVEDDDSGNPVVKVDRNKIKALVSACSKENPEWFSADSGAGVPSQQKGVKTPATPDEAKRVAQYVNTVRSFL